MDRLFISPAHQAAQIFFQESALNLHSRERHVPLQRLVQQQAYTSSVLRHKGQGGIQTFSRVV